MTTHLAWQSMPQQARRYASTGVVTIRLLLLWLLAFSASGATTESIEDGVKAAFLYKFADYVDWPETRFADANTPITIALMDADSIAAELNRIVVGRTAQGRTLAIKRLRHGESIDGVHILFLGGATAPQSGQVLQAAQTHSVLVVTDADGALARGSMINFVLVERHLKFEVALDNVETSGLRLSSRLLAVAEQVYREAP